MYWQEVLSRLSIPGILLLALGAVAATRAQRFFKGERLVLAVRTAGIVVTLLGCAIMLDLIPGL